MDKRNLIIIKILYYSAAFLLPCILLFDLYNRNRVGNHIVFIHVVVLAGLLNVVGLCLFFVFRAVAKSAEGALIVSILFWLLFWLYQTLFSIAVRFSSTLTHIVFMLILTIGIIAITLIFRRYEPPFIAIRPAFNMLAMCLVVLFVFNFVQSVSPEMQRVRAARYFAQETVEVPFYIKRNFVINSASPTPDILWLHLDGMMSLEMVEFFFGESFDSVRDELSQRGFVVYENALLNAGFTDAGVAALLSPAFYDSFLGEKLEQANTKLTVPRIEFLYREMSRVGLTFGNSVVPYYELIVALVARGYEMIIINGHPAHRIPASFEHLDGEESIVMGSFHYFLYRTTGDLPELLSLATPLNIRGRPMQIDIQKSSLGSSPIFNWRALYYTHMSVVYRKRSHDTRELAMYGTAIHIYPLAFNYMVNRMLYYVDFAIERNPDTVVVLQSDHGFHLQPTQKHLLEQGYSMEKVLELNQSVFSAVRIPSAYGGLDSPIAPLNISRELVNRFVGPNYTLLP